MTEKKEGVPYHIEPIPREPWVHLPDGKELASWDKENEIIYNQMNRQAEKALFYCRAFDYINENHVTGDYHEYGCHSCRTFRMALTEARRHRLETMNFFAFDSFEGLPQVEEEGMQQWYKGALNTSEDRFLQIVAEHGLYRDRVRTIKGFYNHVLTRDLQKTFKERENKIALVAVDCDLYKSARDVLRFIEPLLQKGAVIYFDDFYLFQGDPGKGEQLAMTEFLEYSQHRLNPFLNVGWFGKSFIVY